MWAWHHVHRTVTALPVGTDINDGSQLPWWLFLANTGRIQGTADRGVTGAIVQDNSLQL